MKQVLVSGRQEKRTTVHYGWVIIGVYFLILGAGWGTVQGFGVFVNPLAEDAGWSRTAISAASSILIVFNAATGLWWGWLSDRWSTRAVVGVCGALMGLGFFFSSTAHSLWQFYLFLGVIAGSGLGGAMSPLTSLTARWFERRRGVAIGIGFAGMGVGTATLPVLTTYLIGQLGWRSTFQVLSYILWGVFLVGVTFIREPHGRRATSADAEATSGRHPSSGEPAPAGRQAITLNVAARTRHFWLIFGMKVAAFLTLNMVFVHLVPRAVDAGVSASTAATLVTVLAILSFAGILVGGILGDLVGPRRVFIASLVLVALSMVWLGMANNLGMLYGAAALFGLGYGGWAPQFPAIIARAFGTAHMGAIYGALLMGAGLGATIGPVMAGAVFDATQSYWAAFLLAAGIAAAGVGLALIMTDRPSRHGVEM